MTNTERVIKDLVRIRKKLQNDVSRRKGTCSALAIQKIVNYTSRLIDDASRSQENGKIHICKFE